LGVSKSVIHLAMVALLLGSAAPAFAGDALAGKEQPALGIARLNHIGDQVTGLGKDVAGYFGFGGKQANNPTDPQPVAPTERPQPELTARAIEPATAPVAEASLPGLPVAWDPPTPRTETPLHHLFCVEYARIRSGFNIVGDAKQWWQHAASNLYNHVSHPVEEAVMVFSGSKRLRKGHVAVVTSIVGPRQIIVDQANWQNHGEIDHATPVLDVSKNNDWSLVRVWDIPSGSFGARSYPISGFISRQLTRQASAN
jgi:CHAP domain-containing protein